MYSSRIYSEVYEFLNVLGINYINKLPAKLYEFIKSQRDFNFKIRYDKDKPIEKQEISEETLIIISYLNLQYWCNETKKQKLLEIYKENDRKLEEKYNPENLFKKIEIQENIKQENSEKQIIEYKKENYIKRLFDKFIRLILFWKKK